MTWDSRAQIVGSLDRVLGTSERTPSHAAAQKRLPGGRRQLTAGLTRDCIEAPSPSVPGRLPYCMFV
jgi:hypothetical protein